MVVAVAGPAGAGKAPAPAPALTPPSRTVSLLALGWDQVRALGDVSRYHQVIFQHWHHDVVARVHAESPATQVLAYLDAAVVKEQQDRFGACPSVVSESIAPYQDPVPISYCWVLRNRPDWFLRDQSGNPIQFDDFTRLYAVDVRNPELRALWIDNAITLLRAGSFDGAFVDDVMLRVAHGMSGRIVGMSDAEYSAAMLEFAQQIGDRFRAEGLVSSLNVGVDPWNAQDLTLADALAPHVTAMHREYWIRWGSYCGTPRTRFTDPASDGTPALTDMLGYQRRLQARGAFVSAADYGRETVSADDEAAMRYGRAAFLLAWDGRPGSSYFFRACGAADPAREHWTRELGAPKGGVAVTPEGAYRRDFTRGFALVNASPSQSLTVRLPKGTFRDTSGTTLRGTITIPARDAALLIPS